LLERLFALETFGIKLGLENISRLCAALNHPERAFTSIHVAGTNGKGSVTAMVHAALVAAGVRAGRYISPHLTHLSERFVVGSTPISDDELEEVATAVLDRIDGLRASGELTVSPTFFEATTAMAFECFRRGAVEVAVIEVGLGGRFDATNVVPARVGAITSIGFDHQQHLGHSLAAIANEKAGIIKPGMTVVTGTLPHEAREVIEAVASDRGAQVLVAQENVRVDAMLEDDRTVLEVNTPDGEYGPVRLGLRGDHQIGNAIVAIRLLEAATAADIHVPRAAVERGLRDVEWPARLETIDLGRGLWALLDAAHNQDGARALAAYIRDRGSVRPTIVLGVMRDKDVDAILRELIPVASSIVTTAADTPRALGAAELAERVGALEPSLPVRAVPGPIEAVEQALSLGPPLCVTGSILLIGAVRDALRARAILR
jgi:dihydrofolate synthase/folylpolyglutamate synthase